MPAYEDLASAFLWRTLDLGRGTDHLNQITGGIGGFPIWLLERFSYHYGISLVPAIAVLLALILSLVLTGRVRSRLMIFMKVGLTLWFAGISFWLIFPQLTAIHINTNVGRHLLTAYAFTIGGAIYFLILVIRSRSTDLSSGTIFAVVLLCVVLTIPMGNLAQMGKFVAESRALNWSTELAIWRSIDQQIGADEIVITPDENLAKASFLHQPRESFELKEFKSLLIKDTESLDQVIGNECNRHKCYILFDKDQSNSFDMFVKGHSAYFSLVGDLEPHLLYEIVGSSANFSQ